MMDTTVTVAPDAGGVSTPPLKRRRPIRFQPRFIGLAVSVVIVAIALAAVVAPGLLTSRDPFQAVPSDRLLGPSASHWFGTDQIGRDLYSRVIHGAATSLGSAALAVAIGMVCGSLLGLVAGYFRGWVDAATMRFVEVILAIPPLLLALAVVAALGFGTVNVAIAVGVVTTATFARLMRSQVLRVSGEAYVEASRSAGIRPVGVLFRHILPNSWSPVIALSTLEFGHALLTISTLSFLGFGTPPPEPEWGSLVSTGRGYLTSAWWLTTMPGLVIALVVLCTNRISRSIGNGAHRG